MTQETENQKIQEVNRRFESAFAQGNTAALAQLYSSQAKLMPPGNEMLTEPLSIERFWQLVRQIGIKEAKLLTLDLEIHDSTAIEVGQYTLSGADGQVVDQGKYIVIWKKEQDQWKLHRDIWNSNKPPD